MQHQYWSLRRSVLRTLGGKEDDECVVASDAELDAKLELFRSISDSCTVLLRVLLEYQANLRLIAQEESYLGRFLRDEGRGDRAPPGETETREDAAGAHMITAGKALSYTGQQRFMMLSPLNNIYDEVSNFQFRAVRDTRSTIADMEKARGDYRAALSWMKSASAELDPDTGRGLDKFRKAQRHTKESKQAFDKLKLDALQKIDLLAAARCNMFSQVLVSYQSSFLKFTSRVHDTLQATCQAMERAPKYQFSVLKELKEEGEETGEKDKDEMLFFNAEYKDEDDNTKTEERQPVERPATAEPYTEIDLLATGDLVDTSSSSEPVPGVNSDLAGIDLACGDPFGGMPTGFASQLLQDSKPQSFLQTLLPRSSKSNRPEPTNQSVGKSSPRANKTDMSAWFKIFAELDPLANPDAIPGSNPGLSHAA